MTFLIFASMVALVIVGFEILRELKQERGRHITLLVSGDMSDERADFVAQRIASAVAQVGDEHALRSVPPPPADLANPETRGRRKRRPVTLTMLDQDEK